MSSLSMGEEHPLIQGILGAVVTRAQAVLGGVAVSTSGKRSQPLTSGSRTTWIHDRDEQLGAGKRDGGG